MNEQKIFAIFSAKLLVIIEVDIFVSAIIKPKTELAELCNDIFPSVIECGQQDIVIVMFNTRNYRYSLLLNQIEIAKHITLARILILIRIYIFKRTLAKQ